MRHALHSLPDPHPAPPAAGEPLVVLSYQVEDAHDLRERLAGAIRQTAVGGTLVLEGAFSSVLQGQPSPATRRGAAREAALVCGALREQAEALGRSARFEHVSYGSRYVHGREGLRRQPSLQVVVELG